MIVTVGPQQQPSSRHVVQHGVTGEDGVSVQLNYHLSFKGLHLVGIGCTNYINIYKYEYLGE